MLSIENRRYIGSKRSLIEEIYKAIEEYTNQPDYHLGDFFAGTGLVSDFFLKKGNRVLANDILYSNYIAYETWFSDKPLDQKVLRKNVQEFNNIDIEELEGNYFSDIYGGKYFSNKDARKIGFIRNEIEDIQVRDREKKALITSLMYAADRIANTVGHFEHFLSQEPEVEDFDLRVPEIEPLEGSAELFNRDANELAKEVSCDVAYIDPPYNARQYINFYHVLENLARWDKPQEFEGTSMKFKRDHLKSEYSRVKAPEKMRDLVQKIDAELIVVSYNNTYSAKSSSSNNKITEDQMRDILDSEGNLVEVRTLDHKYFDSGKTNFKEHKENLYISIKK